MEITVKHTVDFSPATLTALIGILGSGGAAAKAAVTPAKTLVPAETDVVKTGGKGLKEKAEEKDAAKKAPANDFADLDAEAQLEAIRTEVTKHTKKGKTADIKLMLAHFGAAKAGDLEAATYNTVYDILKRYGAEKDGEMKDFLPAEDDLA